MTVVALSSCEIHLTSVGIDRDVAGFTAGPVIPPVIPTSKVIRRGNRPVATLLKNP